MDITYLRKLLLEKEKEIKTEADKRKIEILKSLLSKDDVFFNIDSHTAIGILDFLGINKDEIKNGYYELIKPQNYQTVVKEYITTSRDI